MRDASPPEPRGRGACDAEVGHQGVAAREHDVFGLDVAMHEVVLVRVAERVAHLEDQADGLLHREPVLAHQPLAQRFALHERHDVVEQAIRRARVDERENVGMLQPREDADLAQEPLGAGERGELAAEHLDGDGTLVPHILGVHDDRGAAPRGDAQESIPVGEMWRQAF